MNRTLAERLRPHPAPVPRKHWISRPRLLGQLVGSPARTVVVTGPAGYGKTTLLVQWQAHRAETRPFLWVTIHPEDDVATVLATISDDVAQVVSASTNETPFVLVLDDLTTGTTPAHVPVAAALSSMLPSMATLAVATRVAPEAAAAWLPVGPSVRFGPQDLAFTPLETGQVLRTITGREPPIELSGRLCEWSEGWPAAVCIAASSLSPNDHETAGSPVTEVGTDRVRDFVDSEVVGALDEQTQDFLLQTSVLDRLTPALCAAVVGRDDAGTILQGATRSHLVVQDTDGVTTWGRYHHLVVGALRLRLETTRAEVLPVLHRRAARGYAAEGLVDEALQHAAASGDDRLLVELLARHWSHFVHTGRYEDARPWLRACGDAVTRDPGLAIAGAWLAGLAGESEAVERLLPVATAGLLDQPTDGFAALRSAVALVHLFMTHRPLSSVEPEVERAATVETRGQTAWQGTAELGLAWVRYLMARPGAADAARAAAASASPDQSLVRGLALALAALVAVQDDQDEEAATLADQSMEAVTQAGLAGLGRAWGPFTAQGAVLARQGRLEAAAETCGRGVELARVVSGMTPWPGVVSLTHLARVQLDLGRAVEAMAAIEEARSLLDRYGHDDSAFTDRLAQLAAEAARSPAELGDDLSSRELQVLRLLQGPLRRGEIARELDVSPNTLKTHVRSIYRKLGVSTRHDAVARARQREVL